MAPVWLVAVLAVLLFMAAPQVYRVFRLAQVKKRKTLARYVYEEELLQTGKVKHEEEYVDINGRQLYRQIWTPAAAGTGGPFKGILIISHGKDSYSGKFAKIVLPFCDAGYIVVGHDHYGHGRSDGIHGYIPSIRMLAGDLNYHIRSLKSRPEFSNLPVFVLGASLGGLALLLHSIYFSGQVQGMILFSPAIRIVGKAIPNKFVLNFVLTFFRAWFPELPLIKATKGKGFSNPEDSKRYAADERTYQGWTAAGTGLGMLEAIQFLNTNLKRVKDPFLVIHGTADEVTDIEGSRALMKSASSAIKKFLELENSNHALIEEPKPVLESVLTTSIKWLDQIAENSAH